jgi:hypothetical protein
MPEIQADEDEINGITYFNELQQLSEEKYNQIEWKVQEYEVTDFHWKCSKEALFLKVSSR